MSSRLHPKWHRKNHHTYTSSLSTEPDAGHDPIASPALPFKGDFVVSGGLSAVAPLSAYAGYFYSDNSAILAESNSIGIFARSTNSSEATATAIYAYAPIIDYGPWSQVDTILALGPKALIVNGYSQFEGPAFFSTIYTYRSQATDIIADNIDVTSLMTDSITAISATFLNTTTTNTTATSAMTFETDALTATNVMVDNLDVRAHGAVAYRNTTYTVSPTSWTLVPLVSAKWDTFSYLTSGGSFKPTYPGIYLCEMNATVAAPSGTSPFTILAGVTTSADLTALGSDPDSPAAPFTGNWFTNNGIYYTNSNNVSGVMFQNTTLVSVNGTTDEIGLYILNSTGNSRVEYARLRIVQLGSIR